MNNRVLKLIVLIENTLSIYRDYGSFSVRKKVMVTLRMAIEIILILTVTTFHLQAVEWNHAFMYRIVYFSLNVIFSIIVILLAVYKSTKFNNLINYLEKIQTYFSGDEMYVKNVLRQHKIIKIILIVYGIISWSIWLHIVNKTTPLYTKAILLCISIVYFICEKRYVIEYIVLYGILAVLSEQIESITRSIAKETEVVIRSEVHEMQIVITQDVAVISKWTQIYSTLKDCSNLINNVFGLQILLSLTISTIYNIMLCYSSTTNYLGLTHEHVVYTTYREIIFMIALLLLSRGTQTTQNSVEELQRRLAGLLIRSTADQRIYKLIRDLLRLITNQPLKTQALGSITINMSLVPKFIMFFTSYTVIALQFNNIM